MSALDIMIVIVILSWVAGLTMRVAGKLIHILLIVAVGMIVFRVIGAGTGGGNRIGPEALFSGTAYK
jgi:ABC-type polysaccharide/polyol phosphate export permease